MIFCVSNISRPKDLYVCSKRKTQYWVQTSWFLIACIISRYPNTLPFCLSKKVKRLSDNVAKELNIDDKDNVCSDSPWSDFVLFVIYLTSVSWPTSHHAIQLNKKSPNVFYIRLKFMEVKIIYFSFIRTIYTLLCNQLELIAISCKSIQGLFLERCKTNGSGAI